MEFQVEKQPVKMTPEQAKKNNEWVMSNVDKKKQILIKDITDILDIVNLCLKKGWVTKEDWLRENIPTKEMAKELVSKYNDLEEQKHTEWEKAFIKPKL